MGFQSKSERLKMSIKDTKSCTAGTTNAPFSGATLTQHSIRGVLSPEMAIERYTIHWLIKHFGLMGDGQDGTDCPDTIAKEVA